MTRMFAIGAACASLLLVAATAAAEDVAQTIGHGEINWTEKTITATGSGAPNLKAANVAVARLGAERAAKMDAFRNILEAVKGVKVSGKDTAGEAMSQNPQVKSKIEGVIRNFKVLDTKYYSDGGVDLVVQVPLDGITSALVDDAGSDAKSKADSGEHSGVIINAKGLKLTPALTPQIADPSGNAVYSASLVTQEAIQQHGAAKYTKSLDGAMKESRVGDKPLVIKAIKLATQDSSDLIVSKQDAEKMVKLGAPLAEGKVIIVTD